MAIPRGYLVRVTLDFSFRGLRVPGAELTFRVKAESEAHAIATGVKYVIGMHDVDVGDARACEIDCTVVAKNGPS